MALRARRHPEGADGDWFIDDRCIGCGASTSIAPELTHRDDVGEAERYAEEFSADVVIHEADRDAAPYANRILTGPHTIEVAPGMVAIPTPGHTEGHVMYLLDDEMLFSGDSLAWEPGLQDLWAERSVCWWSWPDQLDSLERLTRHRFTRVVPTHGAISPTIDPDDMRHRLRRLVASLSEATGRNDS